MRSSGSERRLAPAGRALFGAGAAAVAFLLGGATASPASAGGGREPESAAVDAVIEHARRLSSFGSRVPGYPGEARAREFARRILEEAGYAGAVREEPFRCAVPVDEGATIEVDGEILELACLWPNLVRTPTVAPSGLKGPLIAAGRGEWRDYDGRDPRGAVVLLDFNSGRNWLKAAELGAAAVVFLEPETTDRRQAREKIVDVPVDLPRYYARSETARRLLERAGRGDGVEATIRARMTWREVETSNLVLEIPGTDPELSGQRIVVSSYLDSMSVAPSIAPGASESLGPAAILELARQWRRRPPRRTVLLLLTSGHHLALSGIDAWVQRHARKEKPFSERMSDPIDFTSFLGLDISTGGRRMAVAGAAWGRPSLLDDVSRVNQFMSHEAERMETLSARLVGSGRMSGKVLNAVRPASGHDGFSVLGDRTAFDSALVLCAGGRAVCLTTASDDRRWVDTPLDLPERWNEEDLRVLIGDLLRLVPALIDDPEYGYEGPLEIRDSLFGLRVRSVTFDPSRSYIPDEPVSGAVTVVRRCPADLCGVRNHLYAIADDDGWTAFSSLEHSWIAESYALDPQTGRITAALDRGVNGEEKFPRSYDFFSREVSRSYVLFACRPVDVFGLVDPQFLRPFDRLVVVGRGEAIPQQFGYSFNNELAAAFQVPGREDRLDCAVIFLPPERPFKLVLPQNPVRMGMLLLNGSPDLLEGSGFRAAEISRIERTDMRAAEDVWWLDESRIRKQHGSGIRSAHIDRTHEEARVHLDRAREALGRAQYATGIVEARRALGLESRIYGVVQQISNDVVKGIILYMALLIPFAYAGERLLFGFSDINRRIIAVSGIFLAIFLLLRFLPHPAFELSNAPYIILLAFVTLALSLLVMTIIISRFNSEMRTIRSTVVGVHGADVGRVSASVAAFSLGIANMKRRRVRTFLTSTTVVLLTFALMSFTSVKLFLRYNEIPRPNTPGYPGILVRSTVWRELRPVMLDHLRDEYRGRADVAPRAWWVLRDMAQEIGVPIWSGEAETEAQGIVGVTAQEAAVSGVDRCLSAGRWIAPGRDDECVISDFHARRLGISAKDLGTSTIRCLGRELRVVGILDHQKLETFRDLDNEELTPLDMRPQAAEFFQNQTEFEGQIGVGRKKHIDARVTLWLPFDVVMTGGGSLRSIAIRFRDGSDPLSEAKKALARYALTLFAGNEERVVAYSSVGGTGFGGMGGLAVPIALAGLIILNTMLGSVHERQREIGTYGAVGLAPVHIGSLFVAESFVYAVLGAILGYLIGQGLARAGAYFPAIRALNLNYSSTAVVVTTLIAMGVVLISTIYPARQASRLSVPDVRRRWVLPEPEGNRWEFLFPFTVAEDDVVGLFSFLRDYFSAYTEASVGSFYTEGADLAQRRKGGEREITLSMRAWIAPFDLGVSQDVVLRAVPRGQFDLFNIRMELERRSGEFRAWKMVNQRFIRILRKQFLIWRTVRPDVQEQYRAAGERILGGEVDDLA